MKTCKHQKTWWECNSSATLEQTCRVGISKLHNVGQWRLSDKIKAFLLSIAIFVLQEIHQRARIHGNQQVLHPICTLENKGKTVGDTGGCRRLCAKWERWLVIWETSPCVFLSICGLWTQSAEFWAWGQNSPRMPPDTAGRNLGMTVLHTRK